MFGTLVASLDDPKVAAALVTALDEPAFLTRLTAVADESGEPLAAVVGSIVRSFLETASDDLWTQLIGIMNRAEDPTLAAMRAILERALPQAKEI